MIHDVGKEFCNFTYQLSSTLVKTKMYNYVLVDKHGLKIICLLCNQMQQMRKTDAIKNQSVILRIELRCIF